MAVDAIPAMNCDFPRTDNPETNYPALSWHGHTNRMDKKGKEKRKSRLGKENESRWIV